jgi:hypothetical protein
VKRKNLLIGCGLVLALSFLVMFVLFAVVAKGCHGCATGASGAGTAALVTAQADPRIAVEVGEIVMMTEIPVYSRNYVNGEWYADAAVFVDGKDRDAEYQATVFKGNGEDAWTVTAAQLVLDDGSVVVFDPAVASP